MYGTYKDPPWKIQPDAFFQGPQQSYQMSKNGSAPCQAQGNCDIMRTLRREEFIQISRYSRKSMMTNLWLTFLASRDLKNRKIPRENFQQNRFKEPVWMITILAVPR